MDEASGHSPTIWEQLGNSPTGSCAEGTAYDEPMEESSGGEEDEPSPYPLFSSVSGSIKLAPEELAVMPGMVAGESMKKAWMKPPQFPVAEWDVLGVEKKAQKSLDWAISSYYEPIFCHEVYHPLFAYYSGMPRVFVHR